MTKQQALDLYNQAKGKYHHIDNVNSEYFPNVNKTIEDIMAVDKLCQNLGGGICSRQTIAMIIHFSEKFYD